MKKVTTEEYRARLKQSIAKIDTAVEMGQADGYRICSTPDPASPHAEFWGAVHDRRIRRVLGACIGLSTKANGGQVEEPRKSGGN
jgi:hypothetical protein